MTSQTKANARRKKTSEKLIIDQLGIHEHHYIDYCPSCGERIDAIVVKVKDLRNLTSITTAIKKFNKGELNEN